MEKNQPLKIGFVVYPKRLNKQGQYIVFLRLYKNKITRIFNTDIAVDSLNQFSGERIVEHPDAQILNERLDSLKKRCLSISEESDLFGAGKSFIRQIIHSGRCVTRKMNEKIIPVTLLELLEYRKLVFKKIGKSSSVEMYGRVIQAVKDAMFDMELSSITVADIKYLHKKLVDQERTPGGISMIMGRIKASLNVARKAGWAKWNVFPFAGYKMKTSSPLLLDLTEEEFHLIKNATLKGKKANFARDIFFISFYMGGMNAADIMQVNFAGDKIEYVRKKTEGKMGGQQKITMIIPEEARPYINKWSLNGKIIWPCKSERAEIVNYLNHGFREIRKQLGIQSPLSSYSARKTFSQFAFMAGIHTDIIKYCLGQKISADCSVMNRWKIVQRQAEMAVRRVIDYTENYKEYELNRLAG